MRLLAILLVVVLGQTTLAADAKGSKAAKSKPRKPSSAVSSACQGHFGKQDTRVEFTTGDMSAITEGSKFEISSYTMDGTAGSAVLIFESKRVLVIPEAAGGAVVSRTAFSGEITVDGDNKNVIIYCENKAS